MLNNRTLKLTSADEAIPEPGRARVHPLPSIAGQIVSMSLIVGPVAHFPTRALYHGINQCWNDKLYLTL